MNTKSLITGLLLISLGVFFLGINFDILDFNWYDVQDLWPWLLIGGGVLFFLSWLGDRREYGLLMPASIFTVYGGIFWYCVEYGWWAMGYERLWAFFIVGPGLGFLLMYFLGKRERGLLFTGILLSGIGLLFWSGFENIKVLWPLILILIGVRLLMKHYEQKAGQALPTEPAPPRDPKA